MEDKQYTWTDKDTVVDHTKEVKRLWDLVIPETEKYVKKFNVFNRCNVKIKSGEKNKFEFQNSFAAPTI